MSIKNKKKIDWRVSFINRCEKNKFKAKISFEQKHKMVNENWSEWDIMHYVKKLGLQQRYNRMHSIIISN
jgi:hypothetical protein